MAERIRSITWFTFHVPFLVGELRWRFACTTASQLRGHPGRPRTVQDDDHSQRADVVFVASDIAGRGTNPNTHVSPHGVEFEHLPRWDPSPVPADIAI